MNQKTPTRTITRRLGFILGRAALGILGLIIGLGIFEMGLRLFPIPNRFVMQKQLEDLWESDPELLLHLKPNTDQWITGHPEFRFEVITNAEGLRDETFTTDQTIATVGDSFTFGFGVSAEEAWPSQLESLSQVPVANLGWAGWNSYVYPVSIQRYAIPVHARLWLWAFFVNDLPESAGAEAFITSGQTDFKTWSQQGNIPNPTSKFPFNLRSIQLLAALFSPDLFLLPNSGDALFDDGSLNFRYGRYAWQMSDPTRPEVQRGWEILEEKLYETRQLAAENDAQLVVIFIPSREHVYWPFVQELMADVNIKQLDDVDTRLKLFCDENNIGYLSLLPGLRATGLTGQMLYFPNDGHLNADGHALAASLTYAYLLEHRLLVGE